MTHPCCTLYTFEREPKAGSRRVKVFKVARLTNGDPADWSEWGDAYVQDHPGCRLLVSIRARQLRRANHSAPNPA